MATSGVGEKSGAGVSEDGKWMLKALSGEEGIKMYSRLDGNDKVNEVRCIGILKNGAFVVAGYSVGVCT